MKNLISKFQSISKVKLFLVVLTAVSLGGFFIFNVGTAMADTWKTPNENFQFYQGTGSTIEWTTAEAKDSTWSVYMVSAPPNSTEAYIKPTGVTTLNDLTSVSFWYNQFGDSSAVVPHIDVWLDTNGDGNDDQWILGRGAEATVGGTWTESAFEAMTWYEAMGGTNYGTGTVGLTAAKATYGNVVVLGIGIEVGSPAFWTQGITQKYYVDNLEVNGTIYPLEPKIINTTQTKGYNSIPVAVAAAVSGDTINIASGTYGLSAQLNITNPISVIGQGDVTLKAVNASWSTINGEKHLLGIYAGTEATPVTISNITIDADGKSHAVNTYGNAYGVFNDVTIKNGKGAGLTVNGSTIIATNLNTSGNAWGAVNIDPGSGVTTPSVFTLTSGDLAESNQIWSDGDNVSETATVTVNAEGYDLYKVGGTPAGLLWTNRALTNAATITDVDGTTLYTSIQAAINAASSGDTINVAAGTYDEQVVVDGKSLTLQGAGDTTILRPSAPAKLTATYTHPSTGLFWANSVMSGILMVKNATAVTVKDLKVDGVNITSLPATTPTNDRLSGVLFGESSGTIDNVTVATIHTAGYANRTYGIELSGAATGSHGVEVKNSHVSDWARNGIVANGVSVTANIHNNTLVGPGTISGQVANGIVFIGGVSGNATSNTISGMHYNADPESRSAGIMTYGATTAGILIDQNDISDTDDAVILSASSHDATVRNNNLHDNLETGVQLEGGTTNNVITENTFTDNGMAGIRFGGAGDPVLAEADTPPGAGNIAHKNTFTGNAVGGVVNYDTTPQTFDAINNYWGAASGPSGEGLGAGDSVSVNVEYRPWLLEEGGDTYNQTITLTEVGEWTLVSAPTLLSETPAVVNDGVGDVALLVYEGGEFISPAEDNADIVKPVSAFYAKTTNKGGVGFKYADSVPSNTSKDLTVGWNLVGTNYSGSAINEFSSILNTEQTAGMVTLYIPDTYNARKDFGYTSWGSDANQDLNANIIYESGWGWNYLSEYDGYWIFMNAAKAFEKIL